MSEADGHAAFLQLQQEGWSLKEQEVLDLLNGEAATAAALKKAVLDADLKKVGKASLPDDLNRADGRLLKGPHVLQLVTAQDISVPSQGVSKSTKQRMLLLKLTDGKLTIKGVEFKPFARLDPGKLPPGTKVVVHNASVKAGVVMLDDKCLQVLGGQVEALVDAWEFQRRFGAAERPAESTSDSARPPLFTPFVPGKTRAPKSFLPSSNANSKAAISAPPGFAQAGAQQPSQPRQTDTMAGKDAVGQSSGAEPARAPKAGGFQDHGQGALPDRAHAQGIAKQKLLERLASAEEGGRGRWGRGERRGRGRRGRHDDDDDAGMTLAEWESRQKGVKAGLTVAAAGTQLDADEALARQLQEELDMEDAGHQVGGNPPPSRSAADELKQSLFAFEPPSEERSSMGRRGRGRGRGRSGGSSRRQAY